MDQHPRLCFPTIQQNSSAVTVLPHFIEVCGRKIDNCDSVLDWVGTGLPFCCAMVCIHSPIK